MTLDLNDSQAGLSAGQVANATVFANLVVYEAYDDPDAPFVHDSGMTLKLDMRCRLRRRLRAQGRRPAVCSRRWLSERPSSQSSRESAWPLEGRRVSAVSLLDRRGRGCEGNSAEEGMARSQAG